ncbi:MAG TPA: hypothetical protein VKO45_09265 [Methanomicrobiales archaeon]|nr:hypothetical protein [Methanomicrobiales archaeon]
MKASHFLLVLLLALAVPAASALVTQSGGTVRIAQATDDDVFATGGMVTIDAPVGSLMAAGGQIIVNAPVKGDVIAAGGQVTINSDVGGKVVAAGGSVTVNGKVGTNAVLAGGTIDLGTKATIGRDAMVSGGSVTNAGTVTGKLSVRANTFENRGTAGTLEVELRQRSTLGGTLLSVFGILFTIGLFILGLILIRLAPGRYHAVEDELARSPVVKTVGGFIALIIGFIVILLLAITLVGLPIAILLGLIYLAGVLVSTLFVSSVLGRRVALLLKHPASDYVAFTIGFVILAVLFRIPLVGTLILVVAVSLGFGAVMFTLWKNRACICSPAAPPAGQP